MRKTPLFLPSHHWIPADKPAGWELLGLEVPQIFVQSGWGSPAFNHLGAEVKRRGGHVVGMSDANWRGDFRQRVLGRLGFGLRYRRSFDGMLVPGKQGRRLMRSFGFDDDDIYEGMYGADPSVFHGGASLDTRPPEFLYVGQFIERKNVLRLVRAFTRFVEIHPEWTLRLCGGGAQYDQIEPHPRIIKQSFKQTLELSDLYRNARFFVLPSHVEAWGLVVHEAALSGCALMLSDPIGSVDDLSNDKNSLRFDAADEEAILVAMLAAANMDGGQLAAAESESRRLASGFGPARFASEIMSIRRRFLDAG